MQYVLWCWKCATNDFLYIPGLQVSSLSVSLSPRSHFVELMWSTAGVITCMPITLERNKIDGGDAEMKRWGGDAEMEKKWPNTLLHWAEKLWILKPGPQDYTIWGTYLHYLQLWPAKVLCANDELLICDVHYLRGCCLRRQVS